MVKNAASLGLAQGTARLCSLALIAYVARSLGVEALGELAIGLTIATYVRTGIDLGTPLIGARLAASHPASAELIVKFIQSKRLVSGTIAIGAGCLYALWGPVPQSARTTSLVFVLAVIPWVFSLEWLVWGLERFRILAAFQMSISITHLLFSIALLMFFGRRVVYIACAYGIGMLAASALLQAYWFKVTFEVPRSSAPALCRNRIAANVNWSSVGTLGAALVLNQLFQTVDIVLMGALSTPVQLGIYSAGSKIMLVMYGAFYVATQTAYPRLARLQRTPSINRILLVVLTLVLVVGSGVAAVMGLFARELLVIAYGEKLALATNTFRVLLAALPLELLTASISTILISDGYNRSITIAMAAGAFTSIAANVLLIPTHGAMGAAWANLMSYGVFFASLSLLLWSGANVGESPSRTSASEVPA